jgi:hypothetical protein
LPVFLSQSLLVEGDREILTCIRNPNNAQFKKDFLLLPPVSFQQSRDLAETHQEELSYEKSDIVLFGVGL